MAATAHRFEEIVSQLPGYEPRPQQQQMATLVADAVARGRHAVIEAGTGSGKSFGYLIPLLESGGTAVVSTGTIALQEQLLRKDLPFLQQALGREIRVALAKGRSNYVCLRKLEEARRTAVPGDPRGAAVAELVQLARSGAWEGDRADLPVTLDAHYWSDHLASDPEDCLGPRCPNYGFTPHRLARNALDQAQVIIANHALYFTDLAREAGVLPHHDVVVFDEAHHLDRVAINAFSTQVSRWMCTRLLQRVQRRFREVPPRLVQELTEGEASVGDHLYRRGRGQFPLEADPELSERARALARAFARLATWLAGVNPTQMLLLDDDAALARQHAEGQRDQMASVAQDLAARWEHFATLNRQADRANWVFADPGRDQFELNSAPLDVSSELAQRLWNRRTCILTSATLAVDGRFDYLRGELGLPAGVTEAVLGSPFRFEEQALFYVPRALPEPRDPEYVSSLVPEIERILRVSRGRAFVLCTSYRVLRELYRLLPARIPYPCKSQEDLPRTRLVEWFRETPGAVLLATATFWEGVDVPGEALSCVIIEKLPFANPDDPVVQARTERMKARGEDWFGSYMLPRAILMLKQGFGRLIRTRTDRGLVALLDRRVLTRQYGAAVLRSLPPARRISALPPDLETGFRQAPRAASGRQAYPDGEPPPPTSFSLPPPDLDAVLGEPRSE